MPREWLSPEDAAEDESVRILSADVITRQQIDKVVS
jgi:hypothetical protein